MQDYRELYEITVAERKMLSGRMVAAIEYAKELDRLEIAPNGDDFNALLDILGGKPRQPQTEGR